MSKVLASLVLSLHLCACADTQKPGNPDESEADPIREYLVEAVAQIRNGNYDLARLNLESADSLSRLLQNQYALSSVLSNYGWMWLRQNRYDSAVQYYRRSLEIDLSLEDTTSVIKHSNDLGKSYRAMGDFSEATVHYERALALAETVNDSAKIALCANSLGNVMIELNDFRTAGLYYDRAILYWAALGQTKNYAVGLQNKAGVFLNTGSIYEAIELLRESLLIKDSLSSPASQAYTLASLGDAYLRLDRLQEAENVLARALNLRERLNDKAAIAETKLRLAQLTFQEGEYQRAVQQLEEIEKAAIELAKPDLHRDVLELFKKVLWQQKNYYQYGLVDQRFDVLNDSIYKEERLKVLQAQADMRLDSEKQKTRLAEQNARLSSLETEIEKGRSSRRLQLLLVILLALLVITWQLRLIALRNKSLVTLNARIKLITDNAFHSQANAMGLLSSLMRSQSRQFTGKGEKAVMDMVNQKIDALVVLSRQIFRTRLEDEDGLADKLELSAYLLSLAHETVETMPGEVKVQTDLEDIFVAPKTALNLGLVTNELITNTFKYAVPEGASHISLSTSKKEGKLYLSYEDNGPGFDQQVQKNKSSFGTKMIHILIEKDLNGKVTFESSEKGVKYVLELGI